MREAPSYLDDIDARLPPAPPAEAARLSSLAEVRARLARVRELKLENEDLTARLSQNSAEIQGILHRELPERYEALGITDLGLSAEGNAPACSSELKPFFKASISAEWEPDRRERAFLLLEELSAGDLIKTQIVVELGRGDLKVAKRVVDGLKKAGVPYQMNLGVAWNTLTAWVKDQHKKYTKGDSRGHCFTEGEKEALGITIGSVVDVKVVKAD